MSTDQTTKTDPVMLAISIGFALTSLGMLAYALYEHFRCGNFWNVC